MKLQKLALIGFRLRPLPVLHGLKAIRRVDRNHPPFVVQILQMVQRLGVSGFAGGPGLSPSVCGVLGILDAGCHGRSPPGPWHWH